MGGCVCACGWLARKLTDAGHVVLLFVGCSDGTTALVHHIPGLQLAFHVATLMPNDGRRCSNKKRHIGNNYVTISYLEEGGKRTQRVWRGEVAVPTSTGC